jgi:predicted transport protein
MSDIRLYRLANGSAAELQGVASDLEKPLQKMIEQNLDTLLGIRFLATEYSTGKTHGGRIDSLGLDENNCPVIIEYKRSTSENVINQGLFYMDWLMDHQAEFKLLVIEVLGKDAAESIDWSAPHLVCIAADFTKYDAHAVQQIGRNIELIRYRLFNDELLLLESAGASSAGNGGAAGAKGKAVKVVEVKGKSSSGDKTYAECYEAMSEPLRLLFESLEDFITSLGDDVQKKELKLYVAYKRLKNFTSVVIQKNRLLLYLNLKPAKLNTIPAIARDVSQSGHWGTGDLEMVLSTAEDLDIAKPFISMAYAGRDNA